MRRDGNTPIRDGVDSQLPSKTRFDVLWKRSRWRNKAERISKAELRRLLGLSRDDLDGFLKAQDIWIDYTLDDSHLEMESLKGLGF